LLRKGELLSLIELNIYKVIFAKNEIISCVRVEDSVESFGHYQYVHDKGQLIFAIIKANDEAEAAAVARQIIKDVETQKSGSSFISC